MSDKANWDWNIGAREIADLRGLGDRFQQVHEWVVSRDGERIAAPVLIEEGKWSAVVNGHLMDKTWEKLWLARFTPDDHLTAIVMNDDEWTMLVEGEVWENTFEFLWDPRFSDHGDTIAALVKKDFAYGVVLNDRPWEKSYIALRDFALSPDGRRAAVTVQTVELKEADIYGFAQGTWSVAVDGETWPNNYLNTWTPVFSPDGQHVAVQVRRDIVDYTIAVDGQEWPAGFSCVWEPLVRNDGSAIAPVRKGGDWFLYQDGAPLWDRPFAQLWQQVFSPDGRHVAAVGAVGFGKWTVVLDGNPWPVHWSHLVERPVFSADGQHLAAVVKSGDRWSVAVDGKPWRESFDMVWPPLFAPSGEVITRADRKGRHHLVVNDRVWDRVFDRLFEPELSPDGSSVLVKGILEGRYVREVVPLDRLS